MAGSSNPQPNRPNSPRPPAKPPRKPLQVLHISRKEEQASKTIEKSEIDRSSNKDQIQINQSKSQELTDQDKRSESGNFSTTRKKFDLEDPQGISMADLLGPPEQSNVIKADPTETSSQNQNEIANSQRSVDDFDFDEDAFLAALDDNEPVGHTGEIATGAVIGVESDGVYVDIGGKAPGFMPKNECGLGVIPNLKERFPKGLEVEVLVTREQNADGMVTISCRALALRKSWEKVQQLAKDGQVVQVKINGFNRGGVTCDLEGLRGFIPRSQLENGENHETLVGKTLKTAFLEVNPDTRKLVLSEKRAAIAARFSERTSLRVSGLTSRKAVLSVLPTRVSWFSPFSS